MKLKGLTKLALSGVALAAVAATLGTSTYAWYVSNSVATVGGMSGATAGTESGNVMVCQLTTGTGDVLVRDGNWGNKLTSVTLQSNPNLNPVSKDTDTITPTANPTGWHDKDNVKVDLAAAYGYYAFGLWSTDATSIDMQFGVANTTTSFKYQTAYAAAGLGSGTGAPGVNDQFTVDALNALRVELFQVEFADDATSETQTLATAMASTALGQYCPADTFYKSDLSGAYASPTGITGMLAKGTGVDAHTYYSGVLVGETPAGGTTEATATALTGAKKNLTIGTTGSGENVTNKKYAIVVRYWLEGTDKECFDSCIGQTFSFNFEFTVHQGN